MNGIVLSVHSDHVKEKKRVPKKSGKKMEKKNVTKSEYLNTGSEYEKEFRAKYPSNSYGTLRTPHIDVDNKRLEDGSVENDSPTPTPDNSPNHSLDSEEIGSNVADEKMVKQLQKGNLRIDVNVIYNEVTSYFISDLKDLSVKSGDRTKPTTSEGSQTPKSVVASSRSRSHQGSTSRSRSKSSKKSKSRSKSKSPSSESKISASKKK